ncbi:hypothetical protein KIPB_012364, partial [Kipferlia bialata]
GLTKDTYQADDFVQLLMSSSIPTEHMPPHSNYVRNMYRSVFLNKSGLLRIENAGSAVTVHSLVPAGRRCAVIVTSRKRLRLSDTLTGPHTSVKEINIQ